jgi:dihydrodipicolinate synthase/N-acetylneuraminate lyase
MEYKYDKLYVALMVPFDDQFKVIESELRKHIQYFLNYPNFQKDGGIIANPKAGEVHCLTREEKRRVLEICMEEAGGKVPIFAGTFALRPEDSIQLAKEAKGMGAQGIFVFAPEGAAEVGKGWDPVKYPEVWLDQIKAQDRAVDLPIIIHGSVDKFNPFHGIGFPTRPTLHYCREVTSIVGWKIVNTYGGAISVARGLRSLDHHVGALVAPGSNMHAMLSYDLFDGAVSGAFNFAFELMMDHIQAWKNGDFKKALEIWNKKGLGELQEFVYGVSTGEDVGRLHLRYKIGAWLRGLFSSPFMRPPIPKPRKEEIETMYKLYKKTGLSMIEESRVRKVVEALPVVKTIAD